MYERIYLDSEHPEVFVDFYKCSGNKLPAMLVIPGGGYGCVCADREGAPIAEAFMNKGFGTKEILTECKRLDEVGMDYNFFYLAGIYGAGRGEFGAKNTATVFNQTHPKIIVL